MFLRKLPAALPGGYREAGSCGLWTDNPPGRGLPHGYWQRALVTGDSGWW